MAQARLWLWGLIPLAVLWLVGILFETGKVETDLSKRAGAALAGGPWMPAPIVVRGRDLTLYGEAYDAGDRADASVDADAVTGARRVTDDSRLVAETKPYGWSAAKAGNVVTLSGDVPTPQLRTKLAAVAAAGGARVTDRTVYARGAPDDFGSAASHLVRTLDDLTEGTISVTGTAATITGVAPDAAARDTIEAQLARMPAGVTIREKQITIPAYQFDAVKDATVGTVTLAGTLPDTATRETLLAAARRMFAGAELIDRTKLAAGAPTGFAKVATAGLEQLSRLDSGTLKMSETSIDLSGAALYPHAIDQIKAAIGGDLPGGFAAKADVTLAPPPTPVDASTCQKRFDDLLAKGTVQFETGSATIDKASAGILDHLAAIAAACPSQALEISGHTDASGNDAFNLDLSKKRAQAVVAYLVAAGLDAGHLTAVGFGKTKPIASNETEEGRAKNRRIAFQVKPDETHAATPPAQPDAGVAASDAK